MITTRAAFEASRQVSDVLARKIRSDAATQNEIVEYERRDQEEWEFLRHTTERGEQWWAADDRTCLERGLMP
jgi:hypothetical protein